MIARFELRLEAHRGYRPRLSLRRVPRPGDRFVNGDEPGHLVGCRECSGTGTLHVADQRSSAVPSPAGKNDHGGLTAFEAARAHPLHPVIAEALRWGNSDGRQSGAPTDELWATAYGGSRTWHGSPDEIAALVLAAIAAAPPHPDATPRAWAVLRAAVRPPSEFDKAWCRCGAWRGDRASHTPGCVQALAHPSTARVSS